MESTYLGSGGIATIPSRRPGADSKRLTERDHTIESLDNGDRHRNVYRLAATLASAFEADTIVDLGCGSVSSLMALEGLQKYVVDFGPSVERHRTRFPEATWIAGDLETIRAFGLELDVVGRSIVVCADVIHRLDDPSSLLRELACLSCRAHAVIITMPARDIGGGTHEADPSVAAEVATQSKLEEFEKLLGSHGLVPSFVGLTAASPSSRVKDTMIAIIDHCALEYGWSCSDAFRPLAIMGAYNEVDIAPQAARKFLDDGFDVHVLDNWSTDGTYEQLVRLAAERKGLVVERFPEEGPSRYHELEAKLRRKEEIALRHTGRWILHTDSDEVRCSPWAGISLRGGLHIVERMGFTAVDFTVCDFRPVHDRFGPDMDPEAHIRYFELGSRGDLFMQVKAWRQGEERVDLATSGGHRAAFTGRKVFPYKFILKHFQFRTSHQARRKVFKERLTRYSPILRARGWHIQYNECKEEDPFLWEPSDLIEFDERRTRSQYVTELIAGIGIAG